MRETQDSSILNVQIKYFTHNFERRCKQLTHTHTLANIINGNDNDKNNCKVRHLLLMKANELHSLIRANISNRDRAKQTSKQTKRVK